MNKIDRIIKAAVRESLEEKSEELHSKISNEEWESPKVADEDWNPQGPVTISGTDISEEDEFEMDGEETDITDKSTGEDDETCRYHMANFGPDDERTQMFCKGSITERLHGGQKRLDRNKNGRLDKEDFKLLRGSKKKQEVDEIELSKLKKGGKYKYKSPSFEDEIEYDDEHEYPSGESMHSFRGKNAGGHLMGKKDVEDYVSDFDDFEDVEEIDAPLNKRRPTEDEYVDFEEMRPTEKKSFFSRMKSKLGLGEEEAVEGNAFTGALAKARKSGDDEFEVGGKKFETKEGKYKKKHVKESIELTESEMIDLIEQIVLAEKSDKSFGGKKPKGMAETEKAQKGSKKENDDYIKSVTQKLKDYLKDGSKTGYETSPKHFPKGNGELAKMDKMAYKADDTTQEYIENFTAAGQENLVFDEIHPDEDWMSSNIEGSSKTGNNPEWANSVETGVNKKRNQIRKDNLLGAVKDIAYNKAPQPAEIVKGSSGRAEKFKKNYGKDAASKATKILNQLESTEEKNDILLSEEFGKMKNLINYNKRTQ